MALGKDRRSADAKAVYVNGLALTLSLQAACRVHLHHYPAALLLIKRAWDILDAHAAERQQLGLDERPCSEPRVRLVGSLADIKWRKPDEVWVDEILAPPSLCNTWLAEGERLRRYLSSARAPLAGSESYMLLIENILWAGLWVLACQWRYDRANIEPIVDEWNGWLEFLSLDGGMSAALNDWQLSGDKPSHPWYWSFELVKMWLSRREPEGRLALASLKEVGRRLRIAAIHYESGAPSYLAGLDRDLRWMQLEIGGRDIRLMSEPSS